MAKRESERSVRTRHDPSLIRRLLSERRESGETYLDLETRSGIPSGTLASWARRSGRAQPIQPAFVEIIAGEEVRADDEGDRRFEVVLESSAGVRRLFVPTGFDPAELRQLVTTLEGAC